MKRTIAIVAAGHVAGIYPNALQPVGAPPEPRECGKPRRRRVPTMPARLPRYRAVTGR